MEKNVASQAAGAAASMLASLVIVTVNVPLAATVSALVSACELPLVPVAKFHATSLVVLEQPLWAEVSALVV